MEALILSGAATHQTINVGSGVFNYNLGKGVTCVVESIHVHNILQTTAVEVSENDRITDIETAIASIPFRTSLFTINIYDGTKEHSVTVKNKISFSTSPKHGNVYYLLATSQLDFKQDVFWHFTGENLTVEITEVRDTISNLQTPDITPYKLTTKKTRNPIGFNLPNASIVNFTGGVFSWAMRNMGAQIEQTSPNTLSDGFIIPREGDGITGNVLNGATGVNAVASLPLINLGIIEINK